MPRGCSPFGSSQQQAAKCNHNIHSTAVVVFGDPFQNVPKKCFGIAYISRFLENENWGAKHLGLYLWLKQKSDNRIVAEQTL